jgi:hypothetical protein
LSGQQRSASASPAQRQKKWKEKDDIPNPPARRVRSEAEKQYQITSGPQRVEQGREAKKTTIVEPAPS